MRSEASVQQRREYSKQWGRRNRERKKELDRQRYLNNKSRAKEQCLNWRKLNRDKYNANAREKRKQYSYYGTERYRAGRILGWIRARCENPKQKGYADYGGRGIKCLLSIEDIIFLRNRDGADSMECSSIHRIDNDGDYILENCQYLELSEHMKINHKRIDSK